jgi:predicted PurR-regulated permease PerM
MIFQYVKATFIDLFVLGIGCFIILSFFGMDGALIYAILLAIGNLIPYIGSLVVLFMIAVISILNKGYDIWPMLLCLGLFQQIEANFIQNILFQKVMHVRPLFTFLAFYITQALMGFWWILLSPILAGFLEMFVQATLEIISNSNKMN